MATTKISEATSVDSLDGTEKFPISDGGSSAKSATIGKIEDYLVGKGMVTSSVYDTADKLADFYDSDSGSYYVVIDDTTGVQTFDFRCLTASTLKVDIYLDENSMNETTIYLPVNAEPKMYEEVTASYVNEVPDKTEKIIISICNSIVVYGTHNVPEACASTQSEE